MCRLPFGRPQISGTGWPQIYRDHQLLAYQTTLRAATLCAMAAKAKRKDGKELEEKFGRWITAARRLDRFSRERDVRGFASGTWYEPDAWGERDRPLFSNMLLLGLLGGAVGLPGVLLFYILGHSPPPAWFVLGWLGMVLPIAVGRRFASENVWGECKDTVVTRDHVFIFLGMISDVLRKEQGWKPTHKYIVTSAGGGFEDNALRVAYANDIVCLKEEGDGFVLVPLPHAVD
jgi:hypothetical protein